MTDTERPLYYILDGHDPKPADVRAWSEFFERGPHFVGKSRIDGVKVTTIFMGHDLRPFSDPPFLFESRVFGGRHNGKTNEYQTWDQAVAGHAEMVAMVKS